MKELTNLFSGFRACVSFGARNRSIGAAAKSQVCVPRAQIIDLMKGAAIMPEQRSIAGLDQRCNKMLNKPFTSTGCHELQKHSPRFQEVPWKGLLRPFCAAPEKQSGL